MPTIQAAHDFLDFVNASPTPYHAVHNSKSLLEGAGFVQIKERESWSSIIKPGGKYYLTRNASTLVAFCVGLKWKPGNPIAIVGTHTDSPCLRIKPVSRKQNDGFIQVGVETYGGGLWHTWFDRDLSIAGRVMSRAADGSLVQKLVKIDRPILRIPTLAVHLDRQEPFDFNKETQLFPIAGLVAAELDRQGGNKEVKEEEPKNTSFAPLKAVTERHHPYIVELIAKEAAVAPSSIVDFELVLYDTQKSCLGGLNNELIFSPRLDNLMMTYCNVSGLIRSLAKEDDVEAFNKATLNDSTIRLASLFDHEEIGSLSAQGAESNILPAVIRRLCVLPASSSDVGSDNSYEKISSSSDDSTAFEQTLASSFIISADMAHSVNPNYAAKYEADHRPEMNKGTVIKINANQRYATNSPGIVLLQECAKLAKYIHSSSKEAEYATGVPLQLFVVRNDSSCGGTIGPMSAAKLGARTLDLGNAQLSMHSIRECGGAYDVELAIGLFSSFFQNYGHLEKSIFVD